MLSTKREKIAYIYLVLGNMVGIERKIREQAAALDAMDDKRIELIVLNRHRHEQKGRIRFIKLDAGPFPLSFYRYLFSRYDLIQQHVDLSAYAMIILRYPFADHSGARFVRQFPVITEHHSQETAELRSHLTLTRPTLMTGFRSIRYLLEKYYARRMLQATKGLICNTNEVRTFQLSRTGAAHPAMTVPNGITVDHIPMTGFQPFDQHTLNMVFVGSNDVPWHGIDRMIDAMRRYEGSVTLRLHIIGDFNPDNFKAKLGSGKKVVWHGALIGVELDRVMSEMHLAISTLALYRKKLHENCSLKTREYIARGIPFILAYRDLDLPVDVSEHSFFLELPNDASAIDMAEIIAFVQRMNQIPNLSERMRHFAKTHLDWRIKLAQYIEFVDRLLANKSGHQQKSDNFV